MDLPLALRALRFRPRAGSGVRSRAPALFTEVRGIGNSTMDRTSLRQTLSLERDPCLQREAWTALSHIEHSVMITPPLKSLRDVSHTAVAPRVVVLEQCRLCVESWPPAQGPRGRSGHLWFWGASVDAAFRVSGPFSLSMGFLP